MKTLVKALMVLGLVAMIGIAFAQEEKKGKKKKGSPVAGMMKKVEALDLTAEQKEKIAAIRKEHEPKLEEADAKVDSILTDEQRRARNEAQKAGKAAGKKGKELQAEVDAAVKLTDDQKKKYDEAVANRREAQAAFNKALAGVLSEEQIAKVGLKVGGKKRKKNP